MTPYGTVVYGTGYAYSPWIGSVWYASPYTYGVGAVPVYNPYVGFTYGFAPGLATAAWAHPWWGGAYYYPAYWGGYGAHPCCATASANYNTYTGQSSTANAASGTIYSSTGGGWQQHSSSGASPAAGDTSWADRESQARGSGASSWGSYSEGSHSFSGFGGGGFRGGGRR